EVVPGLTAQVNQVTDAPVQLTVSSDSSPFVKSVESFVESFNSLQSTLDQLTSFDPEALTTGLLFGRSEVVRIETDLARLFTGTFSASSDLPSLEAIGISLDDKGKLELNKTKLRTAYDDRPAEVERLLTADETG